MNINKFRKNLIIKLILLTAISAGIIIFLVIQIATPSFTEAINSHSSELPEDFMSGVRVGGVSGGGSVLLVHIFKIIMALSSKSRLQRQFICENDERKRHIEYKFSKFTLECMMLLLSVGVMISTFFNIIVFWTLYITLATLGLIMIGSNIYFNKKY